MLQPIPQTPPAPVEVDALTPARRKAKGDAKGSGKKGSGKTQRKSGDDKAGKTCYVCGKTGHYARIAGTAKEHPMEGRPTARDRAKERPRVRVAARAMAK